MARKSRPDHEGKHQTQFRINKKKIYASQDVCGICGRPVDFNLKYPHPLSPCIDHIIPIDKGGHPSGINNLQLAHLTCNRQKGNKIFVDENKKEKQINKRVISNRILPQSLDWKHYSTLKQ